MANLWEHDTPASEHVNVPAWIDTTPGEEITCADVAAIVQGGCASGAWMPAVTYSDALDTMRHHGDDVFEFIEDAMGELPPVPEDSRSWSGMACFYLSCAVELWASSVEDELSEALDAAAEDADPISDAEVAADPRA